jgi:hypothetical protein
MLSKTVLICSLVCAGATSLRADSNVYLLELPDYSWYAGCFGTATGNLMGYWDRHGLADFYTGPTAGGVAPTNNSGPNVGIRSLWASKAGFDGRPADKPGHIDDYWRRYASEGDYSYQDIAPDPYVTAGRPEHAPDCIGDFIGLSQRKWTNMNGECDGNIDAFSFVYWDTNGNRRVNYTPTNAAGEAVRDIQSGLREWTRFRGLDADVFTQLVDFNPRTPGGTGFTFEDLKREIDAGYPLMVFLQDYDEFYRVFTGMPRGNPEIHGMVVYGYQEFPEFGINYVRCRTSWGSGDNAIYAWAPNPWVQGPGVNLSVRGVIGYRPKPKVTRIERAGADVTISWQGPSSHVHDALAQTTTPVHRYIVEKSSALSGAPWTVVGSITTDLSSTFAAENAGTVFYRVKLLNHGE